MCKFNSDTMVVREIDDSLVILNVESGEFMSVNNVAKYILEQIISGNSIDVIKDNIVKKYDVNESNDIDCDVSNFIKELKEKSILI